MLPFSTRFDSKCDEELVRLLSIVTNGSEMEDIVECEVWTKSLGLVEPLTLS